MLTGQDAITGIAGRITCGLARLLVTAAAGIAAKTAGVAGVCIAAALRLAGPAFVILRLMFRQYCRQLAVFALLFTGAIAWGYMDKARQVKNFLATSASTTTPALYDSSHRFVGIYHEPTSPGGELAPGSVYSSIPSPVPPTAMFACLKNLEDHGFGTWSTALGFEPASAAKTLAAMAAGHGGGHSPLVSQLARTMQGQTPSNKEAPLEKLERKLGEWKASPALTSILRSRDVDPAQFVTANLSLIAGAPGSRAGELPHGAEAASLIIFGQPAGELPPEEQYLLAAANFRPVLLAPGDNPKALRWTDARWAMLQRRASRCLPLLGAPGTVNYDRARQHLLALPPPRLGRTQNGSSNGSLTSFEAVVNPVRLARAVLGDSGLRALSHDLGMRTSAETGTVSAADLTINAANNADFTRRVSTALARLQARSGARIALRLTGPDTGDDRAQVIVVLADLNGRIIRFYQSGPSDGFDETRPAASLDKALVAAPVLGRFDHADTLYCDAHVSGLHDPGHVTGASNCAGRNGWVPAREAYARSLTQAFVNRLRSVPPDVLRKEAGVLGLTLPKDVPPSVSVPLGLGEAAPRSMLQAISAIGRVLAGYDGDVPRPSLIFQTYRIDHGIVIKAPATSGHNLDGAEVKQELSSSSAYLRDVLAAPLGQRGTLSGLGKFAASRNPAFLFHISKSGTSSTPNGMTRDAMIAGAFQLADGRAFSYFILAGTPDPVRPVGTIGGGSLAPLARITIEEALGDKNDN